MRSSKNEVIISMIWEEEQVGEKMESLQLNKNQHSY